MTVKPLPCAVARKFCMQARRKGFFSKAPGVARVPLRRACVCAVLRVRASRNARASLSMNDWERGQPILHPGHASPNPTTLVHWHTSRGHAKPSRAAPGYASPDTPNLCGPPPPSPHPHARAHTHTYVWRYNCIYRYTLTPPLPAPPGREAARRRSLILQHAICHLHTPCKTGHRPGTPARRRMYSARARLSAPSSTRLRSFLSTPAQRHGVHTYCVGLT